MKVKVKVSEEEWKEEKDSQERLLELYKDREEKIVQRVKNISDLKDLREIISELGDDFEWEESTTRWLKKSEPFEFACLNMRVPGLEPLKERFIFWGIMAFSAAPVARFDHLGDLERILFELDKEKGMLWACSTVAHGFLNQFWEKIGEYQDINDAINSEELRIVFEPGDHSISADLDYFRIRILGVVIPDLFPIIRRIIADKVAKKRYKILSIPTIPHQDFEQVLSIPFYEYVQKVIEIDKLIYEEWRKEKIFPKILKHIKRFIGLETKYDIYDYLLFLYHVMWRLPIFEQEKYLKGLQQIFSNNQDTETEFATLTKELIDHLQELIERTQFLRWQSFKQKDRFKRKMNKEYYKDMNPIAAESIPVSIETILKKTLEDIGYPERSTWLKKIMRLGGWAMGHTYRIMLLLGSQLKFFRPLIFSLIEKTPIPAIGKRTEPNSKNEK